MGTEHWHVTLDQETEAGISPASHPGARGAQHTEPADRSAAALLAAIDLLGLRGEGPEPWAASPSNDPIAFLLDGVADAVSVWRDSSVFYRNAAAERLGLFRGEATAGPERFESGGRSLERRCLRFRWADSDYTLEIVTEQHRR